MFQKSTVFMRIVVIILGIVIAIPVILTIPDFLKAMAETVESIRMSNGTIFDWFSAIFWIALFVFLVPFFMALYQTLKLLDYIDNKETFSEKSIRALGRIRDCAMAIFAIYIVGVMPLMCLALGYYGSSGRIFVGVGLSLVPIAIAVFASMLMKLLREAIEIKSENDLTI